MFCVLIGDCYLICYRLTFVAKCFFLVFSFYFKFDDSVYMMLYLSLFVVYALWLLFFSFFLFLV